LLEEYEQLVNLQDEQEGGTSPLMAAAGSGHHTMVLNLMGHKADPTLTNNLHQTAAWIAAEKGQHRALKALTATPGGRRQAALVIDKFAPPLKPKEGEALQKEPQHQQHTSPLMIATIFGHVEAVQVRGLARLRAGSLPAHRPLLTTRRRHDAAATLSRFVSPPARC
jgi:hypothetical protein